ncbi:MAG: DMT family transporter [Eggerthellaceae bacterium]
MAAPTHIFAEIPAWVYKVMLLSAAAIWGLSFITMKDAVGIMPPAYLIGVRFLATGVILALVFQKRLRAHFNKQHLAAGATLGVFLFLGFWVQTIGLADTTPGKNAFLTATYCVLVPFFFWLIMRKRPSVYNVIAAALCIGGIGLVSLQGSLAIGFGDFMTLVSAIFFAIHIVYVSKLSQKNDILVMTVYQFLVGGACGMLMGASFEVWPAASAFTLDFFWDMAYIVLLASCVALVFQNVGLAHVPPAQGALFLSLESVFGVAFSVMLYGEELSLQLIFGFLLIFVAIVVSETFPLKEVPWHRKKVTSSS